MNAPSFFIVLPGLVTEEAVPLAGAQADETSAEVLHEHSVLDLVMNSGTVVKGVLITLAIMSIITWGIVLTKWLQLRQAKKQSVKFSDVFWSSRNLAQITEASQKLTNSPVAKVYSAG